MRRLCAWCGVILESGSAFPSPTAHGVCVPCAQELLPSVADSSRKTVPSVGIQSSPCGSDEWPVCESDVSLGRKRSR
jgi:hypothetical protein